MKIIINKQAEKVLKQIKKKLVCSDSTAIIIMHELARQSLRRRYR